jgi:hypothetical protein
MRSSRIDPDLDPDLDPDFDFDGPELGVFVRYPT